MDRRAWNIRKIAILTEEPWMSMPDELVVYPFLSSTPEYTRDVERLIGRRSPVHFRSLGLAILRFLVTRRLLELYPSKTPGEYSRIRSKALADLGCFAQSRGLCALTSRDECGAAFVSLIGVMYYYASGYLGLPDAMDILYRWLVAYWPVDLFLTSSDRTPCSPLQLPPPSTPGQQDTTIRNLQWRDRLPLTEITIDRFFPDNEALLPLPPLD